MTQGAPATGWAVVVAVLAAAAVALLLPSVLVRRRGGQGPAGRLRGLGPPGRLRGLRPVGWLRGLGPPGQPRGRGHLLLAPPDGLGLGIEPHGPGLFLARILGRAKFGRSARQPGTGPAAPGHRGGPHSAAAADLTLELIAVGLLAGQSHAAALAAAVAAVPGPLAEGLTSVASALRLGLPPERAWAALRPDAAYLPEIGRMLARVADGGVPAARLLTAKAAALRAASRAEALAAARRVGVLAVFPLVLCLLPAFGLLCVIPAVLTALPGWGG